MRSRLLKVIMTFGAALLSAACLPGCALHYRARIGSEMRQERAAGPARMERHGNVTVVHLYGKPEQMGLQYGTLLGPALRNLLHYARSLIAPEKMEQFLAYARDREEDIPAEVRAHLRATAHAADLPYEELVALNVIPRLMCSTLAVWGEATPDGRLILGRNADYFGLGLEDRSSMVVVYHPKEGRPVVAVTFLGMAGGFLVVNSQGVTAANMLAFATNEPESPDGVTVQLAMRLACERAASSAEAADVLSGMTHVIPMNVMVADAKQAMMLELAADRSKVRLGEAGLLAASNYFRHPDWAWARKDIRCERYEALVSAARSRYGQFTAEDMKAALHAARIEDMNLQAVVVEPGAMRLHVSVNRSPATAGPYVTFDIRELVDTPPAK